MDLHDRELVEGLLAGEAGAAAEIERWVRLAATSFRSRLAHDWEDAVQDALVEVLESLRAGLFRGEGALRGYVWRTAARNCLDRVRRRRRWVFVEVEESSLAPSAATALRDLLSRESRDRLLQLMARLPRTCRDLWREILLGRSYREMSERFGVAEGALRVRVLRCRRRALALAAAGGNERRAAAP
jgi:RNA polymerase sigma factor (sigma-70 family)